MYALDERCASRLTVKATRAALGGVCRYGAAVCFVCEIKDPRGMSEDTLGTVSLKRLCLARALQGAGTAYPVCVGGICR